VYRGAGHQLGVFSGRETEHDALIACPFFLSPDAVHTLRNMRRTGGAAGL